MHLAVSTRTQYQIVFNLWEHARDLYLPTAFVVRLDKEGLPAHIQQRALPETIGAYDLPGSEVLDRLFELTERLQPKALSENFSTSKRRVTPIETLWADRDKRKLIEPFIDRNLSEWLRLITENGFLLSWDAERKVLVNDLLVHYQPKPLEPLLFFKKTEVGVRYRLQLANGQGPWPVSSKAVHPITNDPGWVFVDYQLYRLQHINGNTVKPFQDKDEVRIPQKSVRTYFERFIMKVAEKVEVEAEGFDILQHSRLAGCRLRPVQDFLRDDWGLLVEMDYEHTLFEWHEKRAQRSRLLFQDEEDVRILQISRDPEAERAWLNRLTELGLEPDGRVFRLPAGERQTGWQILEWLAEKRAQILDLGFSLEPPRVEDQEVQLEVPRLQLSAQEENDWFDLKGQVVLGDFTIPFLKIARFIREGKRLFPLPDGSLFLIPEEWMSRFQEVLSFAKQQHGHLRLAKNQYMLLQELGLAESDPLQQPLGLDYQPSPHLKAELRPYQLEGIRWLVNLYHNQLGGCLADDMGLGKTLQTIGALLYAKERKIRDAAREESPSEPAPAQLDLFQQGQDLKELQPLQALIVLPASLVFNWQEELRKFAPMLQVYAHVGTKRTKEVRLLQRWDVILSTYQTVLRDADLLEQMAFEYIVLDESQQIKNRNSKVFKAINRFEGRHKISLSGTPIENSLSDLWSQMQFINPDLLGNFAFFKREFINPVEKMQDEAKKERLRRMVAPYLLRRTKEEVARDLPELSTQIFWCEMTGEQKKLYEREKSAARNYLLNNYKEGDFQYRAIVVKTLTRLRQLVNHPVLAKPEYKRESGKFNDVLDHWEQVRKSGHKALFFSSLVSYLELFGQAFDREQLPYAWLSGSTTPKEREAQVKRFQRDPELQSFLISIKAGGTGLNLTAADYIFILDPWWNPFIEKQAIARAHRIGQDKRVFAFKFITRDSLEEKILRLQERKTQLAEDILERSRRPVFSREELEYLLA